MKKLKYSIKIRLFNIYLNSAKKNGLSDYSNNLIALTFFLYVSCYLLVLGYLNNFKIMESPTVQDSIYFCLKLMISLLHNLKAVDLSSLYYFHLVGFATYIYLPILYSFLLLIVSLKKNEFYTNLVKSIVGDVLCLTLILFILEHYMTLDWNIKGVFFHYNEKMVRPADAAFKVLIFSLILSPVILIYSFKKLNSIISRSILLQIACLSFVFIIAYKTTYLYSGEYIEITESRILKNDFVSKVLWKSADTIYVLNCEDSIKMEGIANEKVLVSNDIDGDKNRFACERLGF